MSGNKKGGKGTKVRKEGDKEEGEGGGGGGGEGGGGVLTNQWLVW